MWKKRMLCLALILCAVILTACQQKETFPTQAKPEVTEAPATEAPAQDIFATAPETINFDDGSYNPASEEGGGAEPVEDVYASMPTTAPTMQSEYAGATPVLIDPVDKPTPTPLPPLTFTYASYEAPALHLSFEAPAGWLADDSQPDTYRLTNPDPSMDYAATLSIRTVPVSKNYTQNELKKEVKGTLDTLGSDGFTKFETSNTAGRKFLNTNGVYANYSGITTDGARIAGRLIIACKDKMLYVLNVSYPEGYKATYVDGVYDKFRHTVKITTEASKGTEGT